MKITRRLALLGATASLAGCGTIAALDKAASPLDTYDLTPVAGSAQGRKTRRTLLIARPDAAAAIASDRIMVKPDAASITYLPDARWTDELPLVVQSLLVRSVSDTGRIGYVGRSDGGPVPDTALLVRIDSFQMAARADKTFDATVDMTLTLLDDKDQGVIGTHRFSQSATIADDRPAAVVGAFQEILNSLLPETADWILQRA